MKLIYIYSLFLLATLGLLVNQISLSKQRLFTASELREVHRRLNAIKSV